MNRIILIILFVMHTLMSGAQHLPQNIGRVLRQERSVVEGYAKEVYITGRKLRSYNLTTYRSFSIDINSKTKAAGKEIEFAVRKDGHDAVDKEIVELAGRLYFAVYTLKQTDSKQKRYLFYKNNTLKNEGGNIVIIYMEGAATLEEIRRKFAN